MLTQNLGNPRIGANRELKKACESYWRGKITLQELENAGKLERLKNWQIQQEAGIEIIPSNDFSFYDQVADWSYTLGVIPSRFETLKKKLTPRDLYFAMCRGYQNEDADVTPLEMTKWFDTNYHYLVPEFEKNQNFKLFDTKVIDEFCEALALGIKTKPVLIGPVTFLMLGKEKNEDFNKLELSKALLPVYLQIVSYLKTKEPTVSRLMNLFWLLSLPITKKRYIKMCLPNCLVNFQESNLSWQPTSAVLITISTSSRSYRSKCCILI